MGVLKYDTLMGKHGFRALFIDQYVCVYKIEADTVFIYHLADARKNYIYHIFGGERCLCASQNVFLHHAHVIVIYIASCLLQSRRSPPA